MAFNYLSVNLEAEIIGLTLKDLEIFLKEARDQGYDDHFLVNVDVDGWRTHLRVVGVTGKDEGED